MARLNPRIIEADSEARITTHPLVQAELRRQQVDLSQLSSSASNVEQQKKAIVELRQRAKRDAGAFFSTTNL